MKEEQIVLFEGNEVKVKTDKGETLINLLQTSRCCGLTRTKGKSNTVIVRWDRVKEKLNTIYCGTQSMAPQYVEEINYILNEIDETDDRNSIYMSSWLSKRLAMECHSQKAMEYKNFLATLDDKREKGLLNQNSNADIVNMVQETINGVLPTLISEIGKTFGEVVKESKKNVDEIKEAMHIQSTVYDNDREELKGLIGFKSANTKAMSLKLKELLENKYERKIKATDEIYIKYKNKIFSEFHVCKWEDIPVLKQSSVFSYIEEYLLQSA